MPKPRKGQAPPMLGREEFGKRFRLSFYDPSFQAEEAAIGRLEEIAWKNYKDDHKAPRTTKAGPEFSDPNHDLSVQWLETRNKLKAAEAKQKDAATKSRVLVICGSARNDGTWPGEMSKAFRLEKIAEVTLDTKAIDADFGDLSIVRAGYRFASAP